jgi:hypothetical protein
VGRKAIPAKKKTKRRKSHIHQFQMVLVTRSASKTMSRVLRSPKEGIMSHKKYSRARKTTYRGFLSPPETKKCPGTRVPTWPEMTPETHLRT